MKEKALGGRFVKHVRLCDSIFDFRQHVDPHIIICNLPLLVLWLSIYAIKIPSACNHDY